MRTKALLYGDIRFQYKYGFYFLYFIFSVLYVSLIFILPEAWQEKAAILMIFSDPAAMGLYFMGSIVLFEKSERVMNSLAISPVKPVEYVMSKLLSIAFISTLVGIIIGISAGILSNPVSFILGVFLGSCLFSAVGLTVAAGITTLNQFVLATIPAELIINIPAIAYLFGWKPSWLLLHPGVCIMELCLNGTNIVFAFFILLLWTIMAAVLTVKATAKSFRSLGGVKL